jgi:hypothetical protein
MFVNNLLKGIAKGVVRVGRDLFVDPDDQDSYDEEYDDYDEYAEEEDSKNDIVRDDGVVLSIDMEKLNQKTEHDLFLSDEIDCPKCSSCGKTVPLPVYIWHDRMYCRRCVSQREIMLSELDPSIRKNIEQIGIIVLKDGTKIFVSWDEEDVVKKLERYRKKRRYCPFEDVEVGKVYVYPEDVKKVLQPMQLYHQKWTGPVRPERENDDD